MNEGQKIMSDSDLIDFFYISAVKNIKDEWFESLSSKWYEYIINLPEKEQVAYTVVVLNQQVNNGGLNQYFVNGYGQFAKETIKYLNLINATKTAEILTNALSRVQNGLKDDVFRKKLLDGKIDSLYDDENLDDYLASLDDKYYENIDDIGSLLANYLRK